MIKIALSGLMRSGKDTTADYIKAAYFPHIKKTSFAEPLYEILYEVQRKCGFEQKKDRGFLQYIGDWARQSNPTVWIDMLLTNIEKRDRDAQAVIITDARYLNELTKLEQHDFVIIQIQSDEEIRIARGASNLNHQSEMETDLFTNYDYVITNNGSFNDLYKQIDKIILDIYAFN